MASEASFIVATPAGVTPRHLRQALRSVDGDDLSKSSPVTGGVPQAAVRSYEDADDDRDVYEVRVAGHDGDWTKTSQTAVSRALRGVADGVEVLRVEGGYEDG